ncbi:MAG: nucleoside phosphorylase [Anaerovoracaceae bacterium]
MVLTFDESKTAIIEPSVIIKPIVNFPKVGLACFSKRLFETWVEVFDGEEIAHFRTEEGPLPIYRVNYNDKHIAVFMLRVGAPCAALQMEEIIAMGLKKVLVMGSCGVLDSSIGLGDLIIPTSGIRDEGTSYHYAPAAAEINANRPLVQKLASYLTLLSIHHTLGKVWTTDAVYRETKGKMLARKAAGCIAVDMEFTALQAVANFRGVDYCQIFYSEDNLDSASWDARGSVINESVSSNNFISIGLNCATII